MAIFIQRLTRAVAVALAFSTVVPYAVKAQVTPVVAQIDSLSSSVDALESKVLSTLMFGGSSPVSFSGEARLKMQFHNMTVYPDFMEDDRTYLQSGWEGNENMFRLGMVVRPGRNTVLWSKLGLQHIMTGDYFSRQEVPTRRDKNKNTIAIHEDMVAGIAIRTIPASFWLKLGNTHWTEASPLTVWKSQPRTFAWEYLPFEIEQPIARYYEYNIAKGEKSGRAAWNKKPFNGINFESINLPWNLYTNFVYGGFERYDNFEREFLDLSSNDLSYSGDQGSIKSKGIGDSYRKVLHGRIARNKTFGDMTIGLNYAGIDYSDDVLFASFADSDPNTAIIKEQFRIGSEHNQVLDEEGDVISQGKVFYKEPKTMSLDFKGPVNEQFSIHADLGLSLIDTTWWTTNAEEKFTTKEKTSGNPVGAFYSNIKYNGFLPIEADIAAIGKGFYSPFSFAVPMDAFFAYGSNLVGAGKFIARGEGSPYAQNMAGINLTFIPKIPGYGHCKIKYGQHFQLEEGKDVLFLPYRLNGADMYTFFHSSYNRWGNGPLDYSMTKGKHRYEKRLGDESYKLITGETPIGGGGAGGLRSDFMAIYEGFVAFDNEKQAMANYLHGYHNQKGEASSSILNETFETISYYDTNEAGERVEVTDTLPTNSSWVPVNQKYTFNLELDMAYDIGPFVGYNNDLFVGGYAALNGVSRSFMPISFSDEPEDMLLWSLYLRLEPAIALHKKFYVLGLLGYETWRSQKSWIFEPSNPNDPNPNIRNIRLHNFKRNPIEYHDFAVGLGFDWDILERVGLHTRVKWMSHKDANLKDNNFQTPVASMEVKTWF
ncbi:MAG: hypothetical protein ACLFVQ_02520 [Chitinispirillaceae bacterium]